MELHRLMNCSSLMQPSSSAFVSCGQPRVRKPLLTFQASLTMPGGVA